MGVGHTNLLSRLQFALIRQGNSLRAMTCAGGVGTALSANWMRLPRAVDYTRFSSACLVQSKSPSEQQGAGFLRKSLGHAPESSGARLKTDHQVSGTFGGHVASRNFGQAKRGGTTI